MTKKEILIFHLNTGKMTKSRMFYERRDLWQQWIFHAIMKFDVNRKAKSLLRINL